MRKIFRYDTIISRIPS